MILGRYLQQNTFDAVLTGTHSLDGDTSQVPSQLGELCGLPQMSHIVAIEFDSFLAGRPVVEVDLESCILTFALSLPAILSIHKDSAYKLPYVAYQDLEKDVSAQVRVVNHQDLGLGADEVGLEGSRTKVRRSFVKTRAPKNRVVVKNDDEGIETVYDYLKNHGFLL